ncbi:cytochrome b-c1 complex subunit 7-like [Mytilus trossulus]|uniref:cytochrome b-c1 complex subunit 7-like n=1 Tax=Mytilus trossulus TaxID=6551 RepID=UPI0030048EE9
MALRKLCQVGIGSSRNYCTAAKIEARKEALATSPQWLVGLSRWAYYKSYFPTLGLMRDDCLYVDKYVKEAVERLPNDVKVAREFRMSRALILSHSKEILPKEEWTNYDEDVDYLSPIVEKVKDEHRLRKILDEKNGTRKTQGIFGTIGQLLGLQKTIDK